MIICICADVSESDLKGHINSGLKTVSDLMFELGVGLGCGMCRTDVERIVIEENQCSYGKYPTFSIPVIKSF